MKTKDLVNISLIVALSFVLGFIKVFSLPNGGSISLFYVPLMYYSVNTTFKNAMLACLIAAFLQIMFDGYIIGALQIILDYIIPLLSISLLALSNNKSTRSILFIIFVICIVSMLSFTLSGIIYFGAPFTVSLIYNASHYIPTIIISTVITFVLLKNLKIDL